MSYAQLAKFLRIETNPNPISIKYDFVPLMPVLPYVSFCPKYAGTIREQHLL